MKGLCQFTNLTPEYPKQYPKCQILLSRRLHDIVEGLDAATPVLMLSFSQALTRKYDKALKSGFDKRYTSSNEKFHVIALSSIAQKKRLLQERR